MSNDFIPEVRRLLSDYIAASGKSQSGAAREMSVSGTTLSQFLSGTYPGDNKAVAQKARQFLELGAARKRLASSPPICLSVKNTERVLTAVKMAHEASHMLLVYGPAGCSKTTSLKHYAEQISGTVYVELDATVSSKREVLIAVLEALEETPRGSTAQIMRQTLSILRNTNRLLIIDECQHMNEKAFDALRAINDKAGAGIVFSGNKSVLKRMFGRMEPEYDQLFSRFGEIVELHNRYSAADIAGIYKEYPVDRECVEYLGKVANQKGGLRRMDKQYKMAVNIAETLQLPLALPFLLEAEKRLAVAGRIM